MCVSTFIKKITVLHVPCARIRCLPVLVPSPLFGKVDKMFVPCWVIYIIIRKRFLTTHGCVKVSTVSKVTGIPAGVVYLAVHNCYSVDKDGKQSMMSAT